MDEPKLSRRETLGLAALAAGMAATPAIAATRRKFDFRTKIDFTDPIWTRDTFVRIDADIDPAKEKCGWLKGRAYGVRDNEKVRPLFEVEGFSFTRTKRLEDGSYRRMLREIVFYRDLETGKILETWHNPYTNEHVKVVPIANDPFNFTIGQWAPEPPSYGGLNKDRPPRRPFLQNWTWGPNGTMIPRSDIDLLYRTLRKLVQRGDGVVVVEHNLDFLARVDWIVDLGPGGGMHGGDLLFCGPFATFLDEAESPTARLLRAQIAWHRPGSASGTIRPRSTPSRRRTTRAS